LHPGDGRAGASDTAVGSAARPPSLDAVSSGVDVPPDAAALPPLELHAAVAANIATASTTPAIRVPFLMCDPPGSPPDGAGAARGSRRGSVTLPRAGSGPGSNATAAGVRPSQVAQAPEIRLLRRKSR